MRNEFVPYNESLELKELGFDELCITSYDTDSKLRNPFDYNNCEYNDILNHQSYFEDAKHFVQNSTINQSSGFIAAPIFSQVFRWFREKYHLIGGIEYIGGATPNTTWWDIYVVGHFNTDTSKMTMKYQPYEEAELACLRKLIEIVKKIKNEYNS